MTASKIISTRQTHNSLTPSPGCVLFLYFEPGTFRKEVPGWLLSQKYYVIASQAEPHQSTPAPNQTSLLKCS